MTLFPSIRLVNAVIGISILLSSCISNYTGDRQISPSGKYETWPTVNRINESAPDYADVIINVRKLGADSVIRINSKAGDAQKWNLDWTQYGDTILLQSSDVGDQTWEVVDFEVVQIWSWPEPTIDSTLLVGDFLFTSKANNEAQPIFKIQECLNDSTISQYHKDVFEAGRLLYNPDDLIVLSIADSLFTTDIDRQLFYFLVFTRSLNGSDGYYSEGAGYAAYEFIGQHTQRFAQYFSDGFGLTDKDLTNWAGITSGELIIAYEYQWRNELNVLSDKLKVNVESSDPGTIDAVDRLVEEMRSLASRNKE